MNNTENKGIASAIRELTIVVEDKFGGSFADQKNQNCELPIVEASLQYVNDDRNADMVLFALPIVYCGARRNGAGNGRVNIGLYTQEQVTRAIEDFRRGKRNAIKLDRVLLVKRHEASIMNQTFGRPVVELSTELTSMVGIKAHFIAKGVKFSTKGKAWEDIVQAALSGRDLKIQYIGSLRAGRNDLQQRGDHIVRTAIPPMFW